MGKFDSLIMKLEIKTEFDDVKKSGVSEEAPLSLFVSRKDITKAGDVIRSCRKEDKDEEEYSEALFKLKQYRENHTLALQKFAQLLENKLKRLGLSENSIVSSRVKRLDSIMIKLDRMPTMQLARMDDLAGVRIILTSMNDLNNFINDKDYCEILSAVCIDKGIKINDRIKKPKSDGYRGIHQIFKCEICDGKFVRIELQIRTKIQHEWATTVEILGSLKRISFKTGKGDEQYKSFFLLTSALFSKAEEELVPEGCEQLTKFEICTRLNNLDEELKIIDKLKEVGRTFKEIISTPLQDDLEIKCYLIQLDLEFHETKVIPYSDEHKANENYAQLEKKHQDSDRFDVVLVSVSNVNEAYPNYFLNSEDFISRYNQLLHEGLKVD